MATFSAASGGYGAVSGSSTTTTRLASSFDPVQNITGLNAGDSGTATRASSTRSGAGIDKVAATSTTSTTRLASSFDPVQNITGLNADDSGTATRASSTRSGAGIDEAAASSATSTTRLAREFDPVQNITGMNAEGGTGGTMLPTAYFRKLRGVVVDENGEPIKDAAWLYSQENLPTGGRVDDEGRFTIYTLKQRYSEFILIGESGRKNVDYTWYQPVSTEVNSTENDVTLVFKTGEIKGLFSGGKGIGMGGPLG